MQESHNQLLAMFGNAALIPAELMLNGALDIDPHARERCNRLKGKELTVEVVQPAPLPALSLTVQFQQDRLALTLLAPEVRHVEPSARIRGDILSLSRTLLVDQDRQALAQSGIDIRGDAGFVMDLLKLMRELDLNWDDLLAPLLNSSALGGAAAQGMVDASEALRKRGQDFTSNAGASINDYLREEIHLLPTRESVEDFNQRLDVLRLRIDRGEARLAQLTAGQEAAAGQDDA